MSAENPGSLRGRRRARWVIAGSSVVATLAVGTAVVLTRVTSQPAAAAPQPPAPARTAEVTRTDLADRRSVDGKLGYGAETTLTGRKPGTVTGLPAAGTVLDRGKPVYQVDAKPVPLFYGDIPLYREVVSGMTKGPDVRVVEDNLKALGFGGFGTPDETFTSATAAAIKKWQKSLGLDQTGAVGTGDVIVTSGPLRVASVTAQRGDQGAGPVLKYTGTDRAVAVEVSEDERDLAKPGVKVQLSVAGTTSTGTITGVTENPPAQGQDTTFTATVMPDDQAATGGLEGTLVDVRFTTETRTGVLTVPVGALLALAEGGYAVEVVEGSARRLVAVEVGLFADGDVEVTGDGLAEGARVVTIS